MGAAGGLARWHGGEGSVNRPGGANDRLDLPQVRDRIHGPIASTSAPSQILETVKLLSAGGIAGAVSKSATAPLARMTILYQVQALRTGPNATQQLSLGRAFSHVVKQEGFRALWKGNGVTVIHRLPYSAINFWAYERFTELWKSHLPNEYSNPSMDLTRRLISGGAAGAVACFLAYPLDLVRTRLSAQTSSHYYTGIGSALRSIVRDEGILGLYRGLGATLAQVAPALAINYAAYETARAHLMAQHPELAIPTILMSLACGSTAGLISSSLTFPLDLVRRRMQLEGQRGSQRRHTSYAGVCSSIYRKQGMRGFYQGIVPEYCKVVPGVAIAFCTYELIKSVTGVTVNKCSR